MKRSVFNDVMPYLVGSLVLCALVGTVFYGRSKDDHQDVPSFSFGWSEYPSSSLLATAEVEGLIDGRKGVLGPYEEKWNVDIVLQLTDYDVLLTSYASNQVDAAGLASMDAVVIAASRPSVNIFTPSWSNGSDALVVTDSIKTVTDLSGFETYGLENSVQQYVFERYLQKFTSGIDPQSFKFKPFDPIAAAQAMLTKQDGVDSVMMWNPFVLQTLRKREGSHVLFSSADIPMEVSDLIVMGRDSLQKPGADRFASALADVYYEMVRRLEGPDGDRIYVATGEKFSNLNAEDMRKVLTETELLRSPAASIAFTALPYFQDTVMPTVMEFCIDHDMLDAPITIGFNDDQAQLNFSDVYLQQVIDNQ